MKNQLSVIWFRRDLRLSDNAGLYHALKCGAKVLPLFIFDSHILDDLQNKTDARVQFIHHTVANLKAELEALGSTLLVKHGTPMEVWKAILKDYQLHSVYTNRDYERYAITRDEQVKTLLNNHGVSFHSFKDQVIFEKLEVCKSDGLPYTVFTPYKNAWLKKLQTRAAVGGETGSYYFQSYPVEKYFNAFAKNIKVAEMPSLAQLGFQPSDITIPSKEVAQGVIKKYDQQRDFPAIEGTSRLGIHFRFGTVSIREKARKSAMLNETFLSELIWRDFYAMILSNFPHVITEPFREKYKYIDWRNDESDFEKWCMGKTGYPIVDAGMRQLNATGYMHNRVRMITASFLTKHLLIDWRWGEAYFAAQLLDFDLASNNGGWQWAAGCGTDAAPYFRIFNPEAQQKKFDPLLKYIKHWIPELGTPDYPPPIVEHSFARERCLQTYKSGLAETEA
jgi:deoxyribodipyrimidine photo-lyase